MKKIIFLALAMFVVLRINAQTVYSTNGILSQVHDTITTNGQRQITGATLNGLLNNMAVSSINKLNFISISPLIWNSSTSTLTGLTASGSNAGFISAADWTRFNSNTLPSQTGHNGLTLHTNGTSPFWGSAGKTYIGSATITITNDTVINVNLNAKDTTHIINYGGATGQKMLFGGHDTLFAPNLEAGTGITLTKQTDGRITLASTASSNPSLGSLGDINFADGTGQWQDDPTQLHWNFSTKLYGIGTNAPAGKLHVFKNSVLRSQVVLLAEGNDGTHSYTNSWRGDGSWERNSQLFSIPNNTNAVLSFGQAALGAVVFTAGVPTGDSDLFAEGVNAMGNIVTGCVHSIAMGNSALNGVAGSSFHNNMGFGYHALAKDSIGSNNIAFGYFSQQANAIGSENTTIGNFSGQTMTGTGNTGLGFQTLYNVTTGFSNTGVGHNVYKSMDGGSGLTTGYDNVAIGSDTTGSGIGSGKRDIAIGAQAGAHLNGSDFTLVGSEISAFSGSNTDVTGSVGIGSGITLSMPNEAVIGSASGIYHFIIGSGGEQFTKDTTLWFMPSQSQSGTNMMAVYPFNITGKLGTGDHSSAIQFWTGVRGNGVLSTTRDTLHRTLTILPDNGGTQSYSPLTMKYSVYTPDVTPIRFESNNSTNYIALKAPNGVTSNVTFTLPTIDATVSGQVIQSNASGVLSFAANGKLSHTIFTPVTTDNITMIKNQYNIINPAGTIAALTVTLPSSPADGDFIEMKYTQIVTTITYAGGTVGDAVTTTAVGTFIKLVFNSGDSKWY